MAAGLGFKTFTTGEVLTADNVNGYLMQGVLVFASAAARDAAITSPQEGQCCYLKDTDAVQTYSGSAWVGFDDSNAIQNSIVDAKGDIVAASGNDTPARLAVGNNGETLVADSSTSTGLRYQGSQAAGKNCIINGGFDIWQRGTSFTSVSGFGVYTSDRWTVITTGTNINLTVSQDTSIPNVNSKFSCKFTQVTSNATSITEYASRYLIEQTNVLPLLGKACALSFWYRSNKTGTHGVRVYGSYNTGGTDQVASFTVNSADTWEYKTIAITALSGVSAASAGATDPGCLMDIGFRVNGAGFTSVNATDYFQLAQVQLELGSVATTFSRTGGTIQGELAACQRYYYRTGNGSNDPLAMGAFATTTVCSGITTFPVTMRARPTALEQSGTASDYRLLFNNTNATCSAVPTFEQASPSMARIRFDIASGGTAGGGATFASNATNGYLAWSAEL